MPNGFNIGPIYIYFYGIIIMLGALAGAWLASFEARRRAEPHERVWDALPWAVIGGVVGARLWPIFTPPASMGQQGLTVEYYLTHPLDALATRNGGLGIPGAIIGGAIALFFFTRYYHLNFPTWTDIVAPGLALGQAIGRWGNFFNQELYGAPSDLPWAIPIDPQYRLPGFENVARFHPLFLYESLWNLANVFFLLWLARRFEKQLKPGDIFLTYLVTYPFGRFCLEFLRLDPVWVNGLNLNQTIMLGCFLVAGAVLVFRHRLSPPATDTQPEENTPASGE